MRSRPADSGAQQTVHRPWIDVPTQVPHYRISSAPRHHPKRRLAPLLVRRRAKAPAMLGSLRDLLEITRAEGPARVAREPTELQLVAQQPPFHSLVSLRSWHATGQTANHKLHDKKVFSSCTTARGIDSDFIPVGMMPKSGTGFRKTPCFSNSVARYDGSKKSSGFLAER
jgi:hypothetical protein